MKRRRNLSPEEKALWRQVADSAVPLRSREKTPILAPEPEKIPPKPPKPTVKNVPIVPPKRSNGKTLDLGPTLERQIETAPLRMDKKTNQAMRRGRMDPEGRIDLHGMTLDQAHPALTRFILGQHAQGKRLVLVITGKGKQSRESGLIPVRTGILKHQVPLWLGTSPLAQAVLQVTQAHQKHGGGGAFYVYLKRKR